jgi:hypothetical protein
LGYGILSICPTLGQIKKRQPETPETEWRKAKGEFIMREPKSLAEWLESKGNPKHHIAAGENGSMVIAIESKDTISPGVSVYNFTEKELPGGEKHFWLSSGWGIRREYLLALKGLLNNELAEDLTEPEMIAYNVMEWRDDDSGEYEAIIDVIKAVSEYHAKMASTAINTQKVHGLSTRSMAKRSAWI